MQKTCLVHPLVRGRPGSYWTAYAEARPTPSASPSGPTSSSSGSGGAAASYALQLLPQGGWRQSTQHTTSGWQQQQLPGRCTYRYRPSSHQGTWRSSTACYLTWGHPCAWYCSDAYSQSTLASNGSRLHPTSRCKRFCSFPCLFFGSVAKNGVASDIQGLFFSFNPYVYDMLICW
jgi:hypothetical protein